MYEDAFETKFLKATEALYHEEGNRYMQETDVSYLVLNELPKVHITTDIG